MSASVQKQVLAPAYPYDEEDRLLEQPPTPLLALNLLRFSHPPAFRRRNEAVLGWCEWRVSHPRKSLGLTPGLLIPVALVPTFYLFSTGRRATIRRGFWILSPPVKLAQAFEMLKPG